MTKKVDRKGLVLIAVLWVVMLLILIVAVVVQDSRLDTKVARLARSEELRCKWACRAGIETALAVLNEDEPESDCLTDLWSENYEDFNDVELEQCWFTVKVVDETSKLNVNTATEEQLLGLPDMTEDIVDAIIDWRDNDDDPSEFGVEGGYYETLRYGYTIRNGPFRTIRELLLVKGITEELLYGEDTNFNGQLDYNERDGDESPPFDDGDDELDKGWIAYLTCCSAENNESQKGKVNINTAGRVVLAALLGGDDTAYRTADDIIAYRDNLTDGMQNIEEVKQVESVNDDTFKKIEDYTTIRSDVFTIRCFATADRSGVSGATLQTEAIVDRSSTPCKILYLYQGASN